MRQQKEHFFRIIVPNYNNAEWFGKCLDSVLEQTFSDYELIIVDDQSTDNSDAIIKNACYKASDKILPIYCEDYKRYNGGARNLGLKVPIKSRYTLFLDSDDWFASADYLEALHDFIVANSEPDCIRLSYVCQLDNSAMSINLDDNSPEKLVQSVYVACWTKCIKSELVQPFPENTLMEDVVQHIQQCDYVETVVPFFKSAIVWNRRNKNSCSRPENQDLQHGKWQSSMYRYMADLLDLECRHDYCEKQRQWRAKVCLENIKKGEFWQ